MNPQPDKCRICRHIKTGGHRCQSPALTGSNFCYYHRKLHRSHPTPSAARTAPLRPETVQYLLESGQNPAQFAPSPALSFPPLEDAESVQLAISLVFASVAARQIERADAQTLLYALQVASANLRILPRAPESEDHDDSSTLVRRVVRTRDGRSLAAPGDDNGVPSASQSLLAMMLDEFRHSNDAQTAPPNATTQDETQTE